jgi:CheY-like chemotaxis protein
MPTRATTCTVGFDAVQEGVSLTDSIPPEPGSFSILCVDDDPQILILLKSFLEREPGFVVETSTSGAEALERADTRNFDAILSDYYMPEMDGISLLREIRARGIPALFVIFTGRHIARVAIDTLNNGGNFYIQKGPDFAEDIPKLIEFLRNHAQNAGDGSRVSPRIEYHTFAGHPRDLLISFLPDGSFLFVNDQFATLAGLENGRIPGDSFFAGIPDNELRKLREQLLSLTPDMPGICIEHSVSFPDNISRVIQWTYRALFDTEGRIAEYQGLGRDPSDVFRLSSGSIIPAPAEPAAIMPTVPAAGGIAPVPEPVIAGDLPET